MHFEIYALHMYFCNSHTVCTYRQIVFVTVIYLVFMYKLYIIITYIIKLNILHYMHNYTYIHNWCIKYIMYKCTHVFLINLYNFGSPFKSGFFSSNLYIPFIPKSHYPIGCLDPRNVTILNHHFVFFSFIFNGIDAMNILTFRIYIDKCGYIWYLSLKKTNVL